MQKERLDTKARKVTVHLLDILPGLAATVATTSRVQSSPVLVDDEAVFVPVHSFNLIKCSGGSGLGEKEDWGLLPERTYRLLKRQ